MKINDILKKDWYDINHMSKPQMIKELKYAQQQAAKRISNYKKNQKSKNPVYSRTIENFLENKHGKQKGNIKVRNDMTLNELRSEYLRVQKLFSAESGTVAGSRKLQKEQSERLAETSFAEEKESARRFLEQAMESNKTMDIKEARRRLSKVNKDIKKLSRELYSQDVSFWELYWKVYQRFLDEHGGKMGTVYASRDIQKELTDLLIKEEDKSIEKIIELLKKKLNIGGETVEKDNHSRTDETRAKNEF